MPRFDIPSVTATRLLDLPNGQNAAADVPSGAEAWYHFASAYRHAADALCKRVSQDDALRHLLALPVLYLYRHSIELHLKSLLKDAGELLDDPQVVPARHYLLTLWKRVRVLLLRIDPRSDGPWLNRADNIIADFDALDPSSFAFRYPVDTAGAPALAAGLRVDLLSIMDIMGELHVILDGESTQIDVFVGYKSEMGGE